MLMIDYSGLQLQGSELQDPIRILEVLGLERYHTVLLCSITLRVVRLWPYPSGP